MPMPTPGEVIEKPSRDEMVDMLRDWMAASARRIEKKLKRNEEPPPFVLRNADQDPDESVFELDADEMEKTGGFHPNAEKIMFYAERDAQALGGRQTYFVTCKGAPGRCPLVLDGGGEEEEDDELGDEEGDEGDLEGGPRGASFERRGGMGGGGFGFGGLKTPEAEFLKLRLDHERFLVHENRTERTEMFRQLNRVIQSQAETIQNYDKENARARSAIEEIMDRKHVRDLEIRQLQKSEEYKEKAMGLLEPFGAAIATKMFGPRAVPEKAQPMIKLFSAVFETFTQEQVVAFMEDGKITFTPLQRQNLMELFMTIQNLRDQEAKAGLNGSANGHANGSTAQGAAPHETGERTEP